MNTIYKTKSQVRTETSDALEKFLRSGGSIEVVKPRKTPTQKMTCKNSSGYHTGTSGFANGYPIKSF